MIITALLAGCFTIDDKDHDELLEHAGNEKPVVEAVLEVYNDPGATAYADSLLHCNATASDLQRWNSPKCSRYDKSKI